MSKVDVCTKLLIPLLVFETPSLKKKMDNFDKKRKVFRSHPYWQFVDIFLFKISLLKLIHFLVTYGSLINEG